MSDQTDCEVAEVAVAAIEGLNRRMYFAGEMPVPDLYQLLGSVTALTRGLTQLIEQVSAGLQVRQDLGGLRLDADGENRYPHPGAAIAMARLTLAEAARDAQACGRHLHDALRPLATVADTAGLDDLSDEY